MAGTFQGLTQKQIDDRIKAGRGAGNKELYKPFIYTREVSSLGRSHRVYGHKCQRVHHLLSDLELAVFMILDWSPGVLDIREQFPLRTQDTVAIAAELKIPHRTFKSTPQVLSSDFLVDFDDIEQPQIALQVKYSADLSTPETVERLAIEHAYWKAKGVRWAVVTEKEVPKVAFTNIEWMHNAKHEVQASDELDHYFALLCRQFLEHPEQPIIKAAQTLDMAYDLQAGEALRWLRTLMAQNFFLFDISRPYRQLTGRMLQPINGAQEAWEALRVSS